MRVEQGPGCGLPEVHAVCISEARETRAADDFLRPSSASNVFEGEGDDLDECSHG
jgi:hypothetical protein